MIQQAAASFLLCLAMASGGSPALAQQPLTVQDLPPDSHVIMGHLDWDDNGKISRDESTGQIRERFDELDRDGDGYLTTSELVPPENVKSEPVQPKLGKVLINSHGAMQGYTLFAPMGGMDTYLIDMKGEVVQTWHGNGRLTGAVYLLKNGNLLRAASPNRAQNVPFKGQGSMGGVIQEIAPSGEVVWEYYYISDKVKQHHDIEPLPNGNVLILAWELKDARDIRRAGGDMTVHRDGELWVEHLVEVRKNGPRSGEIVWEWHSWDHMVQDFNRDAPNYGSPKGNPQRMDLNYNPRGKADWQHANSVDYDPVYDQIVLSFRSTNEVWVIDHSTTTEEAASSSGGRMGRGGDILFRWGNPAVYGGEGQAQLAGQHDATWIPDGAPGEGNLLIFNNGDRRSRQSDVVEVRPDNYRNLTGLSADVTWSYERAGGIPFYASHISGAQRLTNGNTLICDGPNGRLFEVSDAGQIVWEYQYGNTQNGQTERPRNRNMARGPRQGRDRNEVREGQRPAMRAQRQMAQNGSRNHLFRATRITIDHPGIAALPGVHGNRLVRNTQPSLGMDL